MPDVDLTYTAGTCTVGVGDTTVVGIATLWAQPTNVRQWDMISIDNGPLIPIIAAPTNDLALSIPAWSGAAKVGVTYVIYQISPRRFVGSDAMTDVETMLAALNTDGWYRYVNPAFADPTAQGIVANEGQFALKFTTGQLWIMTGGVWILTGVFKPFGVAAPFDIMKIYNLQDVATLGGSSYVYINATPSVGNTPPNATYWAVLASIGFTPWLPAVVWATGVAMVAGPPATLVTINNATYVCLVSHVSGTFATDLAAGKWQLVSATPFLPLAAWATGVAMVSGPPTSYVSIGGSSYVCLVSHVSGTFATDLAAGKWDLVGSIGSGYLATSTTSLALSVASKVFTTQAGLAYLPGARIRLSSAANTNNYMEGIVTAYAGTSMTCNVARIAGSGGPFADWNLNCVGDPGSGDLLSTNNLSDVASAATSIRNLGGVDLTNTTVHSSAVTLTSSDFNKLHLLTGSAAFTVTLPTPVGNGGKKIALMVDDPGNATKLYTVASPSGNVGRGTSLVMWATEVLFIQSDGTNWKILQSKQIPFVGTLNKTTNQSITTGSAWQNVTWTSASNDPSGLNLAFAGGLFTAPRNSVYTFDANVFMTSVSGGTFMQSSFFAGAKGTLGNLGTLLSATLFNIAQISLNASATANIEVRSDTTTPVVAGAALASFLNYREISNQW